MSDTLSKTPREISIEKGKNIVVTIVVLFIFFEVILSVIKILNGQPITFPNLVRFLLTIVAGIYLYKGRNWARLLLAFGSTVGAFFGVYAVFLAWKNAAMPALLFSFLVTMTAFYALAAYNLIFANDIDEYLRSLKE